VRQKSKQWKTLLFSSLLTQIYKYAKDTQLSESYMDQQLHTFLLSSVDWNKNKVLMGFHNLCQQVKY